MEMIKEILKSLELANSGHGYNYEDVVKQRVESYNRRTGDLTGYDCPECNNKGYVMSVRNGTEEVLSECKCMPIRRTRQNIRKSGLEDILEGCTFDTFNVTEEWQGVIKNIAQRFVTDHEKKWFFAGGQVGCGKTHLCTAITGTFLKAGMESRYVLWMDEVNKLKANIISDVYARDITKLKEVPVLYIDDLFKTERDKKPTTSDIKITFEILNYRYMNPNLITIISSEHNIDDIIDIDEAIGSRIYERSKSSCICIGQDSKKNYRLR